MKNFKLFKKLLVLAIVLLTWNAHAWAGYNWYGNVFFLAPDDWDLSTYSYVQLGLTQDAYVTNTTYVDFWNMTRVSDTRLFVVAGSSDHSSWNKEYVVFTANTSNWGTNGGIKISNCACYTSTVDYGFSNNDNPYLFTPSESGNLSPISGSYCSTGTYYGDRLGNLINKNQTIYLVTNGSSSNTGGSVNISGKEIGVSNTSTNTVNVTSSSTSVSHVTCLGSTVTLTATPAYGYEFQGWYTAQTGGDLVSADAEYSYTCKEAKTLYARFTTQYAYIEGRFRIYNSARNSITTTYADGGQWEESSTSIQMTYDAVNHRFYLHTYMTPTELSATHGTGCKDCNPYFYIKTSSSSSSLADVKSYRPSASAQQITGSGTGNKKTVSTASSEHSLRINASDASGYAILYFNGTSNIWYTLEHSVVYDANNASSGTAPATTYHDNGTNVTLATNTGSLTRTGYKLVGWNTENDGSGTHYELGGTLSSINANTKLYAEWLQVHTPSQFSYTSDYGKTPAKVSCDGYEWYSISKNSSSGWFILAGEQTSSASGSAANVAMTLPATSTYKHQDWFTIRYYGTDGSGTPARDDEFANLLASSAPTIKFTNTSFALKMAVSGYTQFSIVAKDNDNDKSKNKYIKVVVDGTDVTGTTTSKSATVRRFNITSGEHLIELQGTSGNAANVLYAFSLKRADYPTPTSLAASSITSSGATLTVTDALSTGDYDFYVSESSTKPAVDATPTESTDDATSVDITGLTASTSYYAWVRSACSDSRKSDWVALTGSYFTTSAAGCSATAPGTISKGTLSGCSITLTASGSAASNNTWYWQASADGTSTSESGATKDVTAPGTYYIRSFYSTGSCWSDAESYTITASDLTPAAPSALAAASPTAKGVTLTVTDAANTNDYEFYVNTSSSAPEGSTPATHSVTSGKSLTITDLYAGTTFYAWARAKCGSNKSAWTALTDDSFETSTVSVTHTLTNVSKTDGATSGVGGSDYEAVYEADEDYSLPTPVVTIGGNTATSGTDYTWTAGTGTISIPANKINGNIVITLNSAAAAPSSVAITGNWLYFAGETISLTATPTGGNGPVTYQWYKGGKENGNAIEGATTATYTKATCAFEDAGSYYCKVTCGGSQSTWGQSGNAYDVKIPRLYVKTGHNNDLVKPDYGNVDFTRATASTATASIVLGSNGDYCFNIADGCGHYYGNAGTMQYNSTGWITNVNNQDCGLTTTNAGTYIFTINYSNWAQFTTTVTFPSCTEVTAVEDLECSAQTGTTLTYTWTKASNASGYTATLYSDSGCETEVTSTDIDNGNTETVTFTSLSANTTYYCKVLSHGDGTTYCEDGGETSAASGTTLAQYDVTTTLNNVTKASGTTGTGAATHGTEYSATFTADAGYVLPSDVTVTIGGAAQTKGTGYSWSVSSGTGTFTVSSAKVTGDITLTITATRDASSLKTLYRFKVKSGISNGNYASSELFYQNIGDTIEAFMGGTLQMYNKNGSNLQINTNAIKFNDDVGKAYVKMNLDTRVAAGDLILANVSGTAVTVHTAASETTTLSLPVTPSKAPAKYATYVPTGNGIINQASLYLFRSASGAKISELEIVRPLFYMEMSNSVTNTNLANGAEISTSNYLTYLSGGTVSAGCSSTGDLAIDLNSSLGYIKFCNDNGYVKIVLDNALAKGDIIAFADERSSYQLAITTSTTRATTYSTSSNVYQITSDSDPLVGQKTFYVWRASSNTTYIKKMWIYRPSYEVQYDGNGETSGSVAKGAGTSVTIASNDFTKTDYRFVEWNTKADGNGISYDPSDVVTKDLLLYAIWEEDCTPIPSKRVDYSTTNIFAYGGTPSVAYVVSITNPGNGTVTYSSSNTDVATVDSETGLVTAVGPGTTTITAAVGAGGEYCGTNITKTITVQALVTQEINVGAGSGSGVAWGTPPDMTFDNSTIAILSMRKVANISNTGYTFNTSTVSKENRDGRYMTAVFTGVPTATSKDDDKYLSLQFKNESYRVRIDNVVLPIQPKDNNANAIATISDGTTTYTSAEVTNIASGKIKDAKFTFSPAPIFDANATITVKFFVYNQTSGGFRLASPILVDGSILRAKQFTGEGNWDDASNWEYHDKPETYHDVDVWCGASMTITDNKTAHDLKVKSGATLNVSTNSGTGITLTLNRLNLEGGLSTYATYDMPRVYIDPKSSIARTKDSIYFDIAVDARHYYPIAMPFDVKIDEVDYANTRLKNASIYGTHYVVKYYDGERRATVGADRENNWVPVEQGESNVLKAGTGYILTAVKVAKYTTDGGTIRFPMKVDDAWLTTGEQATVDAVTKNKVNVYAWNGVDENSAARKNKTHKGWNLVGVPYMSCFQTGNGSTTDMPTDDAAILPGKLSVTGEWDEEEDIMYVSIPTSDFSEYIQKNIVETTTKLLPGWCFFIQLDNSGTLTFSTAHETNSTGIEYRAPKAQYTPIVKTGITLSGADASDNTSFLISDRFSTDYEIGKDLEKLFGETGYTLATYSLIGGTKYAYNALSETDIQQVIPIGYRAPEDGDYTFSINPIYAENGAFEHVYLIDYETNIITDLMSYSYTFSTERTQSDTRFALNIVKRQDTATDIETVSGEGSEACAPRKLLINNELYIILDGKMYDATGKAVK